MRSIQLAVLQEFGEVCDALGAALVAACRHACWAPLGARASSRGTTTCDVAMRTPRLRGVLRRRPRVRAGRARASLRTDPTYCFPYAKLDDAGTRVVEH